MTSKSQNLKTSREAANNESNSTSAGSATKSCDKHFVEVELVGEDDKGVAGIKYMLTLPDGTELRGVTNSQGLVLINGTDPGSCQITFPDLDKETWETTE